MATVTFQQPTDMRLLLPAGAFLGTITPVGTLVPGVVSYWSGIDLATSDWVLACAGTFTRPSSTPIFTFANVTLAELQGPDRDQLTNIRITNIDVGSTPALLDGLSFIPSIGLTVEALLAGDDTITGSSGGDGILAGLGNDIISGGPGADALFGGFGSDTASYASASAGVVANLLQPWHNTGEAAGDTYDSIENVVGSAFNDALYGDQVANSLSGGAGRDLFAGLGGADRFNGGAGSDTVSYDATFAGVRADLLQPGTNTGDAVGDRYISIENLDGSSFNDTLFGDNNANVIRGNTYPALPGGQDSLFGRGGNDALFGKDDNDWLDGGTGQDRMAGGPGADRFDLNSVAETGTTAATRDIITDFRHLLDDIDVSTIDASSVLAGNNSFAFRGAGSFTTSAAGELRFEQFDNAGTVNDFTLVYGDTDADTASEFQIHLVGLVTLTSADIVP